MMKIILKLLVLLLASSCAVSTPVERPVQSSSIVTVDRAISIFQRMLRVAMDSTDTAAMSPEEKKKAKAAKQKAQAKLKKQKALKKRKANFRKALKKATKKCKRQCTGLPKTETTICVKKCISEAKTSLKAQYGIGKGGDAETHTTLAAPAATPTYGDSGVLGATKSSPGGY